MQRQTIGLEISEKVRRRLANLKQFTKPLFGNRPKCTVSGSTVSNTELSEFSGLIEFWGASSVSSFSLVFVCQSELTEFLAELTEFAAELSEFSLPKQCSRNSIPPVPYLSHIQQSSGEGPHTHQHCGEGPLGMWVAECTAIAVFSAIAIAILNAPLSNR